MEKKEPRKKKGKDFPPFWGCTNFASRGCKGKVEIDEAPASESPLVLTARAMSARAKETQKHPNGSVTPIGDLLSGFRPTRRQPDRLQPDPRSA